MNLEEVARLAGVSRSTVSRVVNDDPRVSDEARARVRAVIRATNYHPNAAARSLASARTRILGLMIPSAVATIFADPFFPQLIQGVADACNANDQMLMLLMETTEDATAAERLYRRVMEGRHLDGLIIASSVLDAPILELFTRRPFPVVLVGRNPAVELASVDVDNRGAARAAVEHLLAHGRRRIAHIAGPANMPAAVDRRHGYEDALIAAGLPVDPDLIAQGDFTDASGAAAMADLLARDPRPDALFAGSDVMALAALRVLRERGCRVPDEIAVMGFDGIARGERSDPPLSTVDQPIPELGRAAVDALLRQIEHPGGDPAHRLLPTTLVCRASCGCGAALAAAPAAQPGGGVALG